MQLYMMILLLGMGSSVLLLVIAHARGDPRKFFFLRNRIRKKEQRTGGDQPGKQKEVHINPASRHHKQGGITRYNEYTMSLKAKIIHVILAGSILFLIGYVFYHHLFISLLLALLGFFSPKLRIKSLIHKRKSQLNLQFKQALYSISSSLSAGKSVENSFREASQDLRFLYPNPRTDMIQELDLISRKIENGVNIEQALLDLAERSDIEDIKNFAEVFSTCKRTGGDLVEVVRRTSEIIGEKLEIQQEIQVLVAQKRLESRILVIAPFLIVAVLGIGSPDYMQPLYQEPIGFVVMTVALALNIVSFLWVSRIMNIKV